MLFSSITFLYYFLPAACLLYFLTPAKHRNLVLLLTSLLFYGWSDPRIVLVMLLTVTVSYGMGILTEKYASLKKLWLSLTVLFSIGNLMYFKYADFFIESFNDITGLSIGLLRVALPIGISFYTFQILSYNIDVYRGQVPPQKNFVHLATYVSMFPQLVAGPIVRYQTIESQLQYRIHTLDKAADGMRRFIYGLGKKVIIANALGEFCAIFQESNEKTLLFAWLYAAAFTLQIYYDFSGYSDMAIGLGKILGFDFMENFNYPFISKSITEFWRRWHISLGTWFRDYVYIPLGGSHCSPVRNYLNIFVVWAFTGFWHGAAWNFLLWGLYFAILLCIEKKWLLKKLHSHPYMSHLYVIVAIMVSFVLFNGDSLTQVAQDLVIMMGISDVPFRNAETLYYLASYKVIFILAIIGAGPWVKATCKRAVEKYRWLDVLEPFLLVLLLIIITAYLVDGSFNPFLYFRF
ncbi:MAG: MBOAT family protein [Firmicutes bacterium]|nr:MBOAT family protein [Bacillota bacterium]